MSEGLQPSSPASAQPWVEIDSGALKRNLDRVLALLPDRVGLIASVKKDAYGHGLIEAGKLFAGNRRVAMLGVFTLAEGKALRRAGIRTPILCLSVLHGDDLREAAGLGLTLTITDLSEAREAEAAATAAGVELRAHLKIDTGMGRLGRLPEEVGASLPDIFKLRRLRVETVYTHLAGGAEDYAAAKLHYDRLRDFIRSAQPGGAGSNSPLGCHIGGSDALLLRDELDACSARMGIALYGYHPGVAGLEPAMNFKSRVLYRRRAPAGTRISYGGTYTLTRDSELALVGAGYGNGYLRSLSNRGQVLIRGERYPVLGRVCMDQIVVDVTEAAEGIPLGEEVVLFGTQKIPRGEAKLGADEVAEWAGTIPYEMLCLAGQINPRRWIGAIS